MDLTSPGVCMQLIMLKLCIETDSTSSLSAGISEQGYKFI